MPALQVMIDGFIAAAELVALLFTTPAWAAEASDAQRPPMAASAESPLLPTLVSSWIDLQIDGPMVDVRVSQVLRNDSEVAINLAPNLSITDESTEVLRIYHRDRSINLLQGACGDDDPADDELQSPTAGHAQLQFDELIADALQLSPGETVSIELVARQPITRTEKSYRLGLPKHAPTQPQAILIDQKNGAFLVVIPHPISGATALLTLRPFYASGGAIGKGSAEPEGIELGRSGAAPVAFIVPLADRAALEALEAGAIELETRLNDQVIWSTLPVQTRTATRLARGTAAN
ncbi:MAG: hypothetical protein ABJA83_07505 [Burkholderiaceae bacterium]